MTQAIALATVLATAMLLDLGRAAVKAAAGDWGWGLGYAVLGPGLAFYVALSVLYLPARLLRGRAIAPFTASRLNWAAAAVALMLVLAAAAPRG